YVYRYRNGAWVEEAKLTASDATALAEFGFAVSISGDVIVVTADRGGGGTFRGGAAYVFRRAGGTWIQEAKLVASDATPNGSFGSSVSVVDDVVVVGASDDCSAGVGCGIVYAYRRIDGVWAEKAKLTASDTQSVNAFGTSISLSGDAVVAGARLFDCNPTTGVNCGKVYVFDLLGPDCNCNSAADVCDIAAGAPDNNANGIPDVCECPVPEAPVPDAIEAKVRYLSFAAGDPGHTQAVRITAVDIPPPHSSLNGTAAWVSAPRLVSENPGSVGPLPGFPNFNAATLTCAPVFSDWSAAGTVHVWARLVVPGGLYAVQVINSDVVCDTSNEASFSPALNLTQSVWGDLVGAFDSAGGTWRAPDGVVAVISDVIAIIDKFAGRATAPIKARVDIEPATPDRLINISDATRALDAFRGKSYPFSPGPPCP
ncbi:MAG: FG-GAP repeat protein, partial [Phycisphaerae bacterium]